MWYTYSEIMFMLSSKIFCNDTVRVTAKTDHSRHISDLGWDTFSEMKGSIELFENAFGGLNVKYKVEFI